MDNQRSELAEGDPQALIKFYIRDFSLKKSMNKSFYRWSALFLLLTEVFIAVAVPGDTYPFIRFSLGDLLVVILLYALLKSFVDIGAKYSAISVLAFAYMVEFAQYFHIANLLGIKSHIIRVIIGTSFSIEDLVMYTLGALIAYLLDTRLSAYFSKSKT